MSNRVMIIADIQDCIDKNIPFILCINPYEHKYDKFVYKKFIMDYCKKKNITATGLDSDLYDMQIDMIQNLINHRKSSMVMCDITSKIIGKHVELSYFDNLTCLYTNKRNNVCFIVDDLPGIYYSKKYLEAIGYEIIVANNDPI